MDLGFPSLSLFNHHCVGDGRAASTPFLMPAPPFFCLLSQSVPAYLLHPGLQDRRTTHPVRPELHGGVCGVPGAGKSRQHPTVHAFYHGEWECGKARRCQE